ncbi:MAG: DNA-binding domain-containing protein [Proteobacteria bacterium]|nr:DNA-binding domain-containing protein [Pseudomonadota bacterium]
MSNIGLQYSFVKSLLAPDAVLPTGLVSDQKIDLQKRFSVYRNNVMSSLVSALTVAFPTVEKIVGDQFFKAMAAVYVRQYPPKSPVLMFYGDEFPMFLRGFAPVSALPYLSDVARLEQLRRQVYHAADAPSLSSDVFSEIAESDLFLTSVSLQPASEIAAFQSPTFSIWNWNSVEGNREKQDILSTRESGLIWRVNNEVRMRLLPLGIEVFLRNLKQGLSLGESAKEASATPGFDLTAALTTLFETRLVTAVNLRS